MGTEIFVCLKASTKHSIRKQNTIYQVSDLDVKVTEQVRLVFKPISNTSASIKRIQPLVTEKWLFEHTFIETVDHYLTTVQK